jgi:hypothetical protein
LSVPICRLADVRDLSLRGKVCIPLCPPCPIPAQLRPSSLRASWRGTMMLCGVGLGARVRLEGGRAAWGQGHRSIGGLVRGEQLAASQPLLNSLGKQQHWEGCPWLGASKGPGGGVGCWGGCSSSRPSPVPGTLAVLDSAEFLPSKGKEGLRL